MIRKTVGFIIICVMFFLGFVVLFYANNSVKPEVIIPWLDKVLPHLGMIVSICCWFAFIRLGVQLMQGQDW